jgi:hypothetical protein
VYGERVLEQLGEAIEELRAPLDAQELEALLRLRDRLDARVSEVLRAFDEVGAWKADGSLSLTAWVAWHGRRSRSRKDAHREAVVSKRLAHLPVTARPGGRGPCPPAR